tara:strand:- start:14772 stop:15614 length:843 start_codon:yes stop_codon:yes gene_type:complete
MRIIKENKVLICPDIHQATKWADRILRYNDFDHVVFLGDYFDTSAGRRIGTAEYPDVEGIGLTCDWINRTYKKLGDKATWLMGNHDLSYLSVYKPKDYRIPHKDNRPHTCSGFTSNCAKTINKKIDPEWINNLELCVGVENDIVGHSGKSSMYILSHAGFHHRQFKPVGDELDNINSMYDEWNNDKLNIKFLPNHWISNTGECRSTNKALASGVGSPVWMDWDDEFEELDDYAQMTGHTTRYWANNNKPSRKGGSWCIDCNQTYYAIIDNIQKKLILKKI